MNHRRKHYAKTAASRKTGSKPCGGCCERCQKISDGVYVTPFFLSQQTVKKEKH